MYTSASTKRKAEIPLFEVAHLEQWRGGYRYKITGCRQEMFGWRRGTEEEVKAYAEEIAKKATHRLRTGLTR